MLDDPELITPAGALQMMLAVSAPHLAGKVTLEWFHLKQHDHAEVEWQPRPGEGFPPPGRFALKQGLDIATRLDDETRIAADAVNALYERIQQLDIGLWGVPQGGKDQIQIPKRHRQAGSLNIWTEVFEGEVPAFRYTAVHCVKADVVKIAKAIATEARDVLKQVAPDSTIRAVIEAIYDEAHRDSCKPPNINELADIAKLRLKALGYDVSGRHIKAIGSEPQFEDRRGKVGVRRS
jgi:hypothetical protein